MSFSFLDSQREAVLAIAMDKMKKQMISVQCYVYLRSPSPNGTLAIHLFIWLCAHQLSIENMENGF